MNKFFKCVRCWRKATHSIGYFNEQTYYCTKHWNGLFLEIYNHRGKTHQGTVYDSEGNPLKMGYLK